MNYVYLEILNSVISNVLITQTCYHFNIQGGGNDGSKQPEVTPGNTVLYHIWVIRVLRSVECALHNQEDCPRLYTPYKFMSFQNLYDQCWELTAFFPILPFLKPKFPYKIFSVLQPFQAFYRHKTSNFKNFELKVML